MRIYPLSENAVTVEFGSEISERLNKNAIWLASKLETDPFPGFIEAVPAYASTTVFFEPRKLDARSFTSSGRIGLVTRILWEILEEMPTEAITRGRRIEVPIRCDPASAPDLAESAARLRLSADDLISIFCSREYRVYMLGFLPGFAYMGEVDEAIALPRKETPRVRVPTGSIGIAGRQTGIYPSESPGGWQLIGRTDMRVFNADADPPCVFKPGDIVTFVLQR